MQVYTYVIDNNIYVNLTNRCSNNCEFCIRTTNDGISGYHLWLDSDPTAADIIADLEAMELSKYEQIVFCGFGEPIYCYEVIKDVSNYAHSHNMITRINTNGQAALILGRDITDDIGKYIDIVNVSLNATDANKYDEICHSEFGMIAYDAMLEFARLCVGKCRVVLSVVDTVGADEIKRASEIASSIGAELRVRKLIE